MLAYASGITDFELVMLQNVDRLRGIPAIAIQGCIDLVCPPVTAFRLHKVDLQLFLVCLQSIVRQKMRRLCPPSSSCLVCMTFV